MIVVGTLVFLLIVLGLLGFGVLVTEGGVPSGLVIGDENSPFHPPTMIRLVPAAALQGRGGRPGVL